MGRAPTLALALVVILVALVFSGVPPVSRTPEGFRRKTVARR